MEKQTPNKNVLEPAEARLLALVQGAEPLNDRERKMQSQFKEIEKRGNMVEIPSN